MFLFFDSGISIAKWVLVFMWFKYFSFLVDILYVWCTHLFLETSQPFFFSLCLSALHLADCLVYPLHVYGIWEMYHVHIAQLVFVQLFLVVQLLKQRNWVEWWNSVVYVLNIIVIHVHNTLLIFILVLVLKLVWPSFSYMESFNHTYLCF